MAQTITTRSHTALKLTSSAQNPVTITASGAITTNQAYAIYGARSGSWSVTNSGTLTASSFGVTLALGGTVVNGAGSPSALITGGLAGVAIRGGKPLVANNGTITGTGAGSYGVGLLSGGTLANGATSSQAYVGGTAEGVLVTTSPGVVNNDGTIVATGTFGIGVGLRAGGNLTNGANNGTALVSGKYEGVSLRSAGVVTNLATITSSAGVAVYGINNASVVNGSPTARNALVHGSVMGIQLLAGTFTNTVANYGTVVGDRTAGVYLSGTSAVMNGAPGALSATIIGGEYGLFVRGVASITNYGTIIGTNPLDKARAFPPLVYPPPPNWVPAGSFGVNMMTAGVIYNGSDTNASAQIYGTYIGLQVHGAAGTVHNFGTITAGVAGVYTWLGGTVINGSEVDTRALISGKVLGTWNTYPGGTVLNYATITSSAGSGVGLGAGGHPGAAGTVINGSVTDTIATISGLIDSVHTINKGIVVNYGTMISSTGIGCDVDSSGQITNGSSLDHKALISGYYIGANVRGGSTTLANDGTIAGTQTGIFLGGGASMLLNGAPNVIDALVTAGSRSGVELHGGIGIVANYGTIVSTGGYGVLIANGGSLANGTTNLTAASISGTEGVGIFGALGTVVNDGTISASLLNGVELSGGGLVVNGENGLSSALISGGLRGVFGHVSAPTTVVNAGTIIAGGFGVYLSQGGGAVSNGSPAQGTALIAGGSGVVI